VERAGHRIVELRAHLRALSPKATLERGYAIARLDSGAVLRRADEASPGDRLRLTLAEGELAATVDGRG
jgi:exodeoxyribonuclease VII large subunit